jgi:two-component system, LytTR family, sensor kinase
MRPRIAPYVLAIGGAISLLTASIATEWQSGLSAQARVNAFLLNFTYWAIWTALAPAAISLGTRVPFRRGRRVRALLIHAVAGFLFAFGHVALLTIAGTVLRALVAGSRVTPENFHFMWPGIRTHIEWGTTMYWALVAVAHAMAYREEAQARAVRAAQLEASLARAQVLALQRQLQPHFLFNTLQTISALVRGNPAAAERTIEQLGDLLRATLRSGDRTEIPLLQELEYVDHYVGIQQANLGARLDVRKDVAPDVLHALVPPLLLQPLVENAVRHGLAPKGSGGTITIDARAEGERLRLIVADDGVGAPIEEIREGVGLSNARERLDRLYGAEHEYTVVTRRGGGLTVTMTLPLQMMRTLERRTA